MECYICYDKEKPFDKFVKINVDEAEKIAEYFSITAMPTFVGIKNKEVVKFLAGASEPGILDILNKIKN